MEYYSCIKTPFLEGSCCSIKPQVSSVSDLKRCIEVKPSICDGPDKCVPVTAQPNQATALVYLVFGIKGLDKSSVDLRHVLKQTEVFYNSVIRLSNSLVQHLNDKLFHFSTQNIQF